MDKVERLVVDVAEGTKPFNLENVDCHDQVRCFLYTEYKAALKYNFGGGKRASMPPFMYELTHILFPGNGNRAGFKPGAKQARGEVALSSSEQDENGPKKRRTLSNK